MTSQIGCALVGCGHIAKKYANFFNQGLVPEMKLVAVCDRLKEKCDFLAHQTNAKAFVNVDNMMETLGDEIDLIYILTESGHHAPCVFHLLKYKKDLLVEKPFGMNSSECARMILSAEENGVRLFIVKQNRYNAPVIQVKKVLSQNGLGKVFLTSVRMNWCRPQHYYDQDAWRGTKELDGGVLTNQAIHFIDILQWFLGMPSSVYAEGFRFEAKIEMEDTAVAIFHFPNGSIATLESTTAARPIDLEGSIRLLGSDGYAEIGGQSLNHLKALYIKDINVASSENLIPTHGHVAYLKAVAKVIFNKQKPEVDGYEGIKSLQILDAMYQSIRTGQRTTINGNRPL